MRRQMLFVSSVSGFNVVAHSVCQISRNVTLNQFFHFWKILDMDLNVRQIHILILILITMNEPHLRFFKDYRWCLNFIFTCSFSDNGLGLFDSPLSHQPSRRLWDKPAQPTQFQSLFSSQLLTVLLTLHLCMNIGIKITGYHKKHTTTVESLSERLLTELQPESSIL